MLPWYIRKSIWNELTALKFRANRPAKIPAPVASRRKIVPIRFASAFPQLPIPSLLWADHVPKDEVGLPQRLALGVQARLAAVVSPMQPGLPPIDADPMRALHCAYAPYRRLLRAPIRPDEYRTPPDLGALAVQSPYACHLRAAGVRSFEWDFRELGQFAHHPELCSIAARVCFELDPGGTRLRASQIECELGTIHPEDPRWQAACAFALCAATTHTSLIRHFLGVHLIAGSAVAIATRNALPANHPLLPLLWPHVHGTQRSNELTTLGQLTTHGDFAAIFSFTQSGLCALLDAMVSRYDVSVLDPDRDAERRGIDQVPFATPALVNRRALFAVIKRHADRFVQVNYRDDAQLLGDAAVGAWLDQLDQLIPNGIGALLPDRSRASVARLIACFIYLQSVEHEILGTNLWNYQLWSDIQPVRIYRDGRRVPVDVYQRLVNCNLTLNVKRAPLIQDYAEVTHDPRVARQFEAFRRELEQLEAKLAPQAKGAPWLITPAMLEANMNA
jgi:hypothetical protein